jgi:hypothetical protein
VPFFVAVEWEHCSENISMDVSEKFSRMQGLKGLWPFQNRSMLSSLF